MKNSPIFLSYSNHKSHWNPLQNKHPSLLKTPVSPFSFYHQYKKQVPKAYIVLRDNFDLTDDLKKDIEKHCEKLISKYALPYEYEYVSELPKTKVGKVAFNELNKRNEVTHYAHHLHRIRRQLQLTQNHL